MKHIGFRIRPSHCLVAIALVLVGCASRTPAPVVGREGQVATVAGKDVHVVKSGDTLYSIAREHNMDHRELIALNGIENPNQIAVGLVLKLRPPAGAAATPVTAPGVVAQPIAVDPGVEKRPLGGEVASGVNTDTLKREPKAGKEPYSEQALALAQGPAVLKTTEPVKTEAKPAETAPAAAGEERTWLWPAGGKVLSNFGENGSKGVDVAGQRGEPVIAAHDGKVILASNTLRGYGNMVIVKHSETLISVYAHNSKLFVKEGEKVNRGQKIAEMGNSDADRVKLHFEVRVQGKPVDPMKYLPAR